MVTLAKYLLKQPKQQQFSSNISLNLKEFGNIRFYYFKSFTEHNHVEQIEVSLFLTNICLMCLFF